MAYIYSNCKCRFNRKLSSHGKCVDTFVIWGIKTFSSEFLPATISSTIIWSVSYVTIIQLLLCNVEDISRIIITIIPILKCSLCGGNPNISKLLDWFSEVNILVLSINSFCCWNKLRNFVIYHISTSLFFWQIIIFFINILVKL